MVHLPPFIIDLAIILITAGLASIIFKKIGQPVVLGYLLAGFLVSPEFSFLPTVQDKASIQVWAELGVIILIFNLGLEFSFKKLFAVGKGATIAALIEISFMMTLGFLFGKSMGLNLMDSIFLGGIISIASTTIIIRTFNELGIRQKHFVSHVFGILIIEDLIAILLMVLLSTLALTKTFSGLDLITSTSKLIFFLSIWFMAGIFFIPWFFNKIQKQLNSESYLIVSIGLCLLMVVLATMAGFSPALGAFIMGSIIAETRHSEKIEHLLEPVKNLFSAIFFVSVGMLIDLSIVKTHWLMILLLTFIILFGKSFATFIGSLIAGQSIKTSIQSGFSVAQIGEFSFIIATLGLSLGVISDFLYPVAVAVSTLTTLATPYMVKSSDKVYAFIKRKSPDRVKALTDDDARGDLIASQLSVYQSDLIRIFLNTIIIIAITLALKHYLYTPVYNIILNENGANYALTFLALLASLPSFWAIINGSQKFTLDHYRINDIRQITFITFIKLLGRVVLSLFLLGFVVSQFISAFWAFLIIVNLAVIFGFLGARNFSQIYSHLEVQFISRLQDKEKEKNKNKALIPQLAPWNAHLNEFEIKPESQFVGFKLSELKIREKYGVTLVLIKRGEVLIMAPHRDDIIMAYDKISVLGTDDQLTHFNTALNQLVVKNNQNASDQFNLVNINIHALHPWVGQSILDARLREKESLLVVGVERKSQRILNPDSSFVFNAEDSVWVVCPGEKYSALKELEEVL